MIERLGEIRKGRRERIEKGSREGIEKETKRQFEEKENLGDPPLLEFLDPTLRCSHCFFNIGAQASKFIFSSFRGHVQTIFGKTNVIMTWGGGGGACDTNYFVCVC